MYSIKEKKIIEKLFMISLEDIEVVSKQFERLYNNIILKDGTVNETFILDILNAKEALVNKNLSNAIFWQGTTSLLGKKSIPIPECDKLNPVRIAIKFSADTKTAYYHNEEISFTISNSIVLLLLKLAQQKMSVYNTKDLSASERQILKQFLLEKESYNTVIIHELTHWIDFTINKFVKPKMANIRSIASIDDTNFTFLLHNPMLYETLSYFEINAQIHTIAFLKKKFEKEWDSFTIFDVISKATSLQNVFLTLSSMNNKFSSNWLKFILKRLYREGLLGKKMTTTSMGNASYMYKYIEGSRPPSVEDLLFEMMARY